jgi:FixJ family two-component response regulator
VSVVYVVDDSQGTRESLRFLLNSVGIAVEVFESPALFLERYRPGAPGCLILDLRFRDMSGFELLQRMSSDGIELPVFVLTGYATVPMTVRLMQAGALEVIEKPFDPELILERVREAFAIDRRRRSRREKCQWAQERITALTLRELQVAQGIVAGKLSKVIAEELSVSPKTIEAHRKRVMVKTGARSVPALVRMWDLAHRRRQNRN